MQRHGIHRFASHERLYSSVAEAIEAVEAVEAVSNEVCGICGASGTKLIDRSLDSPKLIYAKIDTRLLQPFEARILWQLFKILKHLTYHYPSFSLQLHQ